MSIENPHLIHPNQEIEAATRWSRLTARLIDSLIMVVPLPFLLIPVVGPIIVLGCCFLILVAQMYFLVTRAQSLGKRAMGIYIMRADGSIPHIGWLLIRGFAIPAFAMLLQAAGAKDHTAAGRVLMLVGSLAVLGDMLFIFGPTRRCLHDHLAGTHVVKV
jgi:uncharacterized RDD family membrane protein YckC